MSNQKFTRPPLAEAMAAWQKCLADHGLPAEPLWIFTENLCIEHSRAVPGSFRIGFQTRFTPPPDDAIETAYDHFSESDERIVFYRLGSVGKKSGVWFTSASRSRPSIYSITRYARSELAK